MSKLSRTIRIKFYYENLLISYFTRKKIILPSHFSRNLLIHQKLCFVEVKHKSLTIHFNREIIKYCKNTLKHRLKITKTKKRYGERTLVFLPFLCFLTFDFGNLKKQF